MVTTKTAPISRRYNGNSAEERKEVRRAKLLQAAISVYGARGYRASTVQDVCDAAGLTKRYFYESYSDSGSLLADCFRSVVGELLEELALDAPQGPVRPWERARAILRGYFQALKDDPARARLFLLEADGISVEVVDVMRDAQRAVAELLVPTDPSKTPDVRASLQRLGAVAGAARISSIWIAGNYTPSLDEVVESALSLFGGLLQSSP